MFRNSDEEVDFVWYPALPSAPVLPFDSVFLDPIWQDNYYAVDDGPGLVREQFIKNNWEGYKALAIGLHQCGTAEDFAEGGIYDPDLPPVEYRDDWLPMCCPGGERAGSGGAAMGGKVKPLGPFTTCCPGVPMPPVLTMTVSSTSCACMNRVVTLIQSFFDIPNYGDQLPMWYAETGNGKWWVLYCDAAFVWYSLAIFNYDPTTPPPGGFMICSAYYNLTTAGCKPLHITFTYPNDFFGGFSACLGCTASCSSPIPIAIDIVE